MKTVTKRRPRRGSSGAEAPRMKDESVNTVNRAIETATA